MTPPGPQPPGPRPLLSWPCLANSSAAVELLQVTMNKIDTLYQCPIPQTRTYWEHWIMLNEGHRSKFNITSGLSEAWFGVWDTNIIPHTVCSGNLCSELMRWTLRQNQCTIDTLQSQRYTSVHGEHPPMLPL